MNLPGRDSSPLRRIPILTLLHIAPAGFALLLAYKLGFLHLRYYTLAPLMAGLAVYGVSCIISLWRVFLLFLLGLARKSPPTLSSLGGQVMAPLPWVLTPALTSMVILSLALKMQTDNENAHFLLVCYAYAVAHAASVFSACIAYDIPCSRTGGQTVRQSIYLMIDLLCSIVIPVCILCVTALFTFGFAEMSAVVFVIGDLPCLGVCALVAWRAVFAYRNHCAMTLSARQ